MMSTTHITDETTDIFMLNVGTFIIVLHFTNRWRYANEVDERIFLLRRIDVDVVIALGVRIRGR